MQLELGFGEAAPGDESDEALTALGYATVTALASVAEDQRSDTTSAVAEALNDTIAELDLPVPGTPEHAPAAGGPAA